MRSRLRRAQPDGGPVQPFAGPRLWVRCPARHRPPAAVLPGRGRPPSPSKAAPMPASSNAPKRPVLLLAVAAILIVGLGTALLMQGGADEPTAAPSPGHAAP